MAGWGRSGVCAVVLLAAGCTTGTTARTGSPSGARTETPGRATSTPSANSTAVPRARLEYSFDGSVPAPSLVVSGTDYVRITESLLRYAAWLLAHNPSASLLSQVAARGSPYERAIRHDLAELRVDHLRYVETTAGPDRLTVITALPDAVSLRLVQQLRRMETIDATGRVADSVASATRRYLVLITRGQDRRWSVARIDDNGEAS